MDELLESLDEFFAAWDLFVAELPVQMNLDSLREAISELRDEVTLQRSRLVQQRRLAADDVAERVEQP